ncbi:MAG: hypothetical protein ABI605_11070 [Rhizobacter sp.]
MACDICGKNGTSLVDLRDTYQTSDIKAICPECETIVNRKSRSLLSMVLNIKTALLLRFMRERKEQAR